MSSSKWRVHCRHCLECGTKSLQAECFRHCHESPSGEHQPDATTVVRADVGPNDFIVDVTCKVCRISGSHAFKPGDINWE